MTCTSCRIAMMECGCDDGPCADCDERLYGPPENTVLPATPATPLVDCDYKQLELRVLAQTLIKQMAGDKPTMDWMILDVMGNDVRVLADSRINYAKVDAEATQALYQGVDMAAGADKAVCGKCGALLDGKSSVSDGKGRTGCLRCFESFLRDSMEGLPAAAQMDLLYGTNLGSKVNEP